MLRSGSIGICAGLALSLLALGCGSSNSNSGAGGSGGTSAAPWEMARIANPGTGWWMNAVKGKFFISVDLKNSYKEDLVGRGNAVSITKLIADKSGATAQALVPALSEIPGGPWGNNPDEGYTAQGPVFANNFDKIVEYIDGGADPFFDATKSYKAAAFAWATYIETTTEDPIHKLDIKVWEMASAADAKALFTDLLANSLYSPDNNPWQECVSADATNPCP